VRSVPPHSMVYHQSKLEVRQQAASAT